LRRTCEFGVINALTELSCVCECVYYKRDCARRAHAMEYTIDDTHITGIVSFSCNQARFTSIRPPSDDTDDESPNVRLRVVLNVSHLATPQWTGWDTLGSTMNMSVLFSSEWEPGIVHDMIEQPPSGDDASQKQFTLDVTVPVNSEIILQQTVLNPGGCSFSARVVTVHMRPRMPEPNTVEADV